MKLDPEAHAAMVALIRERRRQGTSLPQLMELSGWCKNVVRRLTSDVEPARRGDFSQDELANLRADRATGMSFGALAKKYRRNKTRVAQVLRGERPRHSTDTSTTMCPCGEGYANAGRVACHRCARAKLRVSGMHMRLSRALCDAYLTCAQVAQRLGLSRRDFWLRYVGREPVDEAFVERVEAICAHGRPKRWRVTSTPEAVAWRVDSTAMEAT